MGVKIGERVVYEVVDARNLNLWEIRGLIYSAGVDIELPTMFYDAAELDTWSISCNPKDNSLSYKVCSIDGDEYLVKFTPVDGMLGMAIYHDTDKPDWTCACGDYAWSAEELEGMEIFND